MGMHVLKPTMTRGEITPLAHARRDIEMYQGAAAELKNWLVLREGGVRRRSGTRFRGTAKDADKDIRLIDFVFLSDQAYVMEFGDEYVRFWTSAGQIVDGLGDPYEIESPYDEAAIRKIQWATSGDTMYIAYRSMTQKSQKLVRLAHDNWEFQDVTFADGPYLPVNDVDNAVTPSTAPVTGSTSDLTFATVDNVNGGAGFLATDVGRAIRVQFDGKWSWGTITVVTSTNVITVAWEDGQGGTTASRSWRLGMFSDTTGYPGSVEIFNGRVVWGSTPTAPRALGYSYASLPEVFKPTDTDGTVTDAHGGSYDIIAGDEILWLQDAPRLQIGMSRAVFSLGAADINSTFGPRNIGAKSETREGVSSVRPVVVGPSSVHASRGDQAINDLLFDYSSNALVRPELSTVSEHLFSAGVKELVFQQSPHRRLWTVLKNGGLVCTTVDRYEKVIGFSPHDVSGEVVSAAVIPGSPKDELWLVVRREIDGEHVQYMETLDPDFLRMPIEDAFFADCGGTYEGVATNTISGITWLANTEVTILADGKVIPNQTVSGSGVLTIPNGKTATKIHFGVPLVATGKLLPVPVQGSDGSVAGRKLKLIGVDVDVYETKGLRIVSDRGASDLLRERPAATAQTGDLQTGPHRLMTDGAWTSEGQFSFVADKPLPATIRAFNIHVMTE